MAIFQGLFRRGAALVAVKRIRISSNDVVEPGTLLPSEEYPLREYQLRRLFRGRSIGVKDSAWANWMLDNSESKSSPELSKKVEIPADTIKSDWMLDNSSEDLPAVSIKVNDIVAEKVQTTNENIDATNSRPPWELDD